MLSHSAGPAANRAGFIYQKVWVAGSVLMRGGWDHGGLEDVQGDQSSLALRSGSGRGFSMISRNSLFALFSRLSFFESAGYLWARRIQ